jgi:hypothetical protein
MAIPAPPNAHPGVKIYENGPYSSFRPEMSNFSQGQGNQGIARPAWKAGTNNPADLSASGGLTQLVSP